MDLAAVQFAEFVAERSAALIRVAYALTGEQHAAADLVQGALGKAFARWRHIDGSAEAYVRRIIYHDHVSNWRRFLRREVPVAQVPDLADAAAADRDALLQPALRRAGQVGDGSAQAESGRGGPVRLAARRVVCGQRPVRVAARAQGA